MAGLQRGEEIVASSSDMRDFTSRRDTVAEGDHFRTRPDVCIVKFSHVRAVWPCIKPNVEVSHDSRSVMGRPNRHDVDIFEGSGTVLADGTVTTVALWQLKAIITKQCTYYMLYLVAV